MGGALIPMAIAWAIQRRMARPILVDAFDLPPTRGIDVPLAAGAVIFGIGWGISGLCPGPAIAGLALAPRPAIVAVLAIGPGLVTPPPPRTSGKRRVGKK